MRRKNYQGFTLTISLLLLLVPSMLLQVSPAAAQSNRSAGVVIADVTFSSNCSITNRTLATPDPDSKVIDEEHESCPAGTVLKIAPANSASEAAAQGGIYVPLTGNNDADLAAVNATEAQLRPTDVHSYSLQQTAGLACADRGFSKSFSYTAYDPGVTVYSTVYYYQTYTCASGLSSAQESLSYDANIYWKYSEYGGSPYYYKSHGCTNLTAGATYDTYNYATSLGGFYRDETINEGGYYGCTLGGGTSYSGGVYL